MGNSKKNNSTTQLLETFINNKFFANPKIDLNDVNEINHSGYTYFLKTVHEERREETKTVSSDSQPQLEEYKELSLIELEPAFQDSNWTGIKQGSLKAYGCSTCKGEQKIPCQPCSGTGRYYNATQKRYYDCHNCQGTGKAICLTCKGTGKLISYIEGSITHRYKEHSGLLKFAGLLKNLPALIKKHNKPIKILLTTKKPTKKETDFLAEEVQTKLNEVVNENLTNQVIKSELQLFEHRIKELIYKCNGKQYSVFYDVDNAIIRGKYPIDVPLVSWMFIAFLNILLFIPLLFITIAFLVTT